MKTYCISPEEIIYPSYKYILLYLDKSKWKLISTTPWFVSEGDNIVYKPFTYTGDIVNVDYFKGSILSNIDNRNNCIDNLLADRLNLHNNCPIRYRPQGYIIKNNCIEDIDLKKSHKCIWFLKENNSAYSKGISVCNNIQDVIQNIKPDKEYILQRNIPNLLLYKNKKFHIRIYLLSHYIDDTYYFYTYRDGVVIISKNKYRGAKNMDKSIHVTTSRAINDALDYKKSNLYKQYHYKIQNSIKSLLKNIDHKLTKCDKNNYSLYGIDILLNKKKNPYILEVNIGPVIEESNKHMVKGLTDIVFNDKNYKTTKFSLIHTKSFN